MLGTRRWLTNKARWPLWTKNRPHVVRWTPLAANARFASRSTVPIEEFGKLTDSPPPLDTQCLQIETGKTKSGTKTPRAGDMISYIHRTIQQYPESVVLTRVGSFYELYFHQAVELAPLLSLRIGRKNQLSPVTGEPYVPMAGFPFYQLQTYLQILVEDLKRTVVLLDQVPDKVASPGSDESQKRPISRILTPGTLIGESFLNGQENNYIAAVQFTTTHLESDNPSPQSPVGLAWLDVSVGSFFYQSTTIADLAGELARVSPREILLDTTARKAEVTAGKWYPELIEVGNYVVTYRKFPPSTAFIDYTTRFSQTPNEVLFSVDEAGEKEISAITALLRYVSENLPDSLIKLKLPEKLLPSQFMSLDSTTRRALELFQTSSGDSVKGTLFNVIDRTVTQSGSRLLHQWLSAPLMDIERIRARQDLVRFFVNNFLVVTQLTQVMRNMDDCHRVVQKLSIQRFDPMDLVVLSRSIKIIQNISDILEKQSQASVLDLWVHELKGNLEALEDFAQSIDQSINVVEAEIKLLNEEKEAIDAAISADLLGVQKERRAKRDTSEFHSILKPDASPELIELHQAQKRYIKKMNALENKLTDAHPNVKIGLKWSPQYGYHVHISGSPANLDQITDIEGHQIRSSKRSIIVQNDEWIKLGLKRDEIQLKKERVEGTILAKLRLEALGHADRIRNCCDVIDQLDVTTTFAVLAQEQSLVCPELEESTELRITAGRHPTVAMGLQASGLDFTSNDCDIGAAESNIWMITGPNMGGKSTFIRQVALITIMAQIGSFVPASSATIGLVDKIFCRLGAGDDLYRGRSTFMVEMLETSNILKNATDRSLAILDEVGRGTSGRDGLAIAYASLLHLLEVNKCRSLYATHFGTELHGMLVKNSKEDLVSYYRTSIHRTKAMPTNPLLVESSFLFDHRLERGISENSQGLLIASLAGFPRSVIANAEQALLSLSSSEH